MEDKITIIEGPTPTFEAVGDGWGLGLNESPHLYTVALTKLRTFNGQALLERCNRAWRNQSSINLEYRDMDGFESESPILAARALESDDGQMLLLWVRLDYEDEEEEVEEGDFGDDDYYDDVDDDPNR
jgi:hypothetical protein